MVKKDLKDTKQEAQLQKRIQAARNCLIDNGIEADEADNVLQALGYILLDQELYPEKAAPSPKSKAVANANFCKNDSQFDDSVIDALVDEIIAENIEALEVLSKW